MLLNLPPSYYFQKCFLRHFLWVENVEMETVLTPNICVVKILQKENSWNHAESGGAYMYPDNLI